MTEGYRIAPVGWSPESANPFSDDGGYGLGWSCFQIRDSHDSLIMNGRPGGVFYGPLPDGADERCVEERRAAAPYCLIVGRGVMDTEARYSEIARADLLNGCRVWASLPAAASQEEFIGSSLPSIETSLADFIRYENAHGRTTIVSTPPDVDADELIGRALATAPAARTVRPSDSRWLVHSTTLEGWEKISGCGELRSSAWLRRDGTAYGGVGLFAFGEPEDYAEYVMLGSAVNIGPEHVVNSQQKGYLITDEKSTYVPGVRLYFDAHSILNDGLGVSDGVHVLKVGDALPLAPYLVSAVRSSDADPEGEVEEWTPWEFMVRANECFVRDRRR